MRSNVFTIIVTLLNTYLSAWLYWMSHIVGKSTHISQSTQIKDELDYCYEHVAPLITVIKISLLNLVEFARTRLMPNALAPNLDRFTRNNWTRDAVSRQDREAMRTLSAAFNKNHDKFLRNFVAVNETWFHHNSLETNQ